MSNEKLQRYFNNIVKVISDACTKKVKQQLCKFDEKNFQCFNTKFNHFSETDCPTLYNFVQLYYVIEDLKKIIKRSPELELYFSQKFKNTEIFFNTIFNSTATTQIYIEILKKLHYFEETASINVLNSLGNEFRKTVVNFQTIQNPSWDLIKQFENQLMKFNKTPELNIHFDPIINLLNADAPKQLYTAPTGTPSLKSLTITSQ